MNKKILLVIGPPFWPNMPPLSLAYLEGFLLQKGINVDILDINNLLYNLASKELKREWRISCNNLLEENILSIIKEVFPSIYKDGLEKILDYDIVGFSCFKSNFKATLEITEFLKSKKKDIKIILGGPEITRQFFKNAGKIHIQSADLVVVGEGELALFNYIKDNGSKNRLSVFCELETLNEPDFPRYKGIDINLYPKKNALPFLFSRGCIKKCGFCSERLLYKKFRTRPLKNIAEEIKYHISNNKTEYFVFHDSMINADLEKLEGLCDAIIKYFGSIKWEAQLYIRRDMDSGLLEKMKKSGCYNLFVGLESGCNRTLRNMNKGFTANDAFDLFKNMNGAGLSFGVSIIVGYPGETKRDFTESLDFVIRNKHLIPKIEQINPFTYYDGTQADRSFDYSLNAETLRRLRIFTDEIKRHGFKHTKAFLGNLIEKNDRVQYC